jgi:hypothetical protein
MLSFYDTPSDEKKTTFISEVKSELKRKKLGKFYRERLKDFLKEQQE